MLIASCIEQGMLGLEVGGIGKGSVIQGAGSGYGWTRRLDENRLRLVPIQWFYVWSNPGRPPRLCFSR